MPFKVIEHFFVAFFESCLLSLSCGYIFLIPQLLRTKVIEAVRFVAPGPDIL